MSHEDKSVVKDILLSIASTFGKLNSKIGNKQTYLGMDIKFKGDGTESIQIKDYIKEVINTFNQHYHITSSTNTLALQNLFMVDTTSPRLETK